MSLVWVLIREWWDLSVFCCLSLFFFNAFLSLMFLLTFFLGFVATVFGGPSKRRVWNKSYVWWMDPTSCRASFGGFAFDMWACLSSLHIFSHSIFLKNMGSLTQVYIVFSLCIFLFPGEVYCLWSVSQWSSLSSLSFSLCQSSEEPLISATRQHKCLLKDYNSTPALKDIQYISLEWQSPISSIVALSDNTSV